MQIIMTISEKLKLSPFDILKQDFDDFALLVNYLLDNSAEVSETPAAPSKQIQQGGIKRIRVNDKTASGGWF